MYLDLNNGEEDVGTQDDVGAIKAYRAWFMGQHPPRWIIKHLDDEKIDLTSSEGHQIKRR